MPRFATAGTKISIGSVLDFKNTDFVVGDFSALTYTEIGGTTSIGPFGDTAQEIGTQEIANPRDIAIKGTRNAGTLSLSYNIDTADAGQTALIAAERTNANYAIKIEYPDKPTTGASPKGSIRYFIGMVMGVPENPGGGPNNFVTGDATIKINSNIVRVAPSAT